MFFQFFVPPNFVSGHRHKFWKPVLVAAGLLAVCTQASAQSEQPDQKTLTERFKAWTVTCVEAETRSCRMTQELVQHNVGVWTAAIVDCRDCGLP